MTLSSLLRPQFGATSWCRGNLSARQFRAHDQVADAIAIAAVLNVGCALVLLFSYMHRYQYVYTHTHTLAAQIRTVYTEYG